MMRKICVNLFLIVILSLAIHLVSHFKTNFHPQDFQHGFHPSFSTHVQNVDDHKIHSVLSQPFTYLSQGKQVTVFESADQQYVIKLFNPMRPLKKGWYSKIGLWKHYCSLKWILRERFNKQERLKKLFERHKMAYELLKNETGLVYVHLNPSKLADQTLQITDNKGQLHVLYLKKTPFILQKKAELVSKRLSQLLELGKTEEAKAHIQTLRSFFMERAKKGITDRIQTIHNNYGFIGNQPIQIDVGRIRYDEKIKHSPDIELKRILKGLDSQLCYLFYKELCD